MSSTQNGITERDPRYCRLWKCQVSVGELYRWILAKLSDKDIKRALHKYRDLMPRQSDWNRKLTQATSMPELGFRYLYRCGQIDESNHRTMQKMLKYIDRQDVLPYFDTILYNTNHANCSLEELQKVLLDKVNVFLEHSSVLYEEEVHPEPAYEIIRRQPVESSRVTRLSLKRKSSGTDSPCYIVKRARRSINSSSLSSFSPSSSKTGQLHGTDISPLRCCSKVRSAIMANSLNGPVVHTMLSASLINMLASLHTTLSQALENSSSLNNSNTPGNCVNNFNPPSSSSSLPANNHLIFHLLTIMPHLIAISRSNQSSNLSIIPNPVLPRSCGHSNGNNNNNNNNNNNYAGIYGPRFIGLHNRPMVNVERRPPPQQVQEHVDPAVPPHNNNNNDLNLGANGIDVPVIYNPHDHDGGRLGLAPPPYIRLLDNLAAASVNNPQQPSTNAPVLLKHVVLSAGGVGITSSSNNSLIQYYCNIKLHVSIDFGPSTESLRRIQTLHQDFLERQIDFFIQASNTLKARSLGEFVCNLQFTRLNQLEDFWADYQSGALRSYLMSTLKSKRNRGYFGEQPPPPSQSFSSSSVGEQPDVADQPRQNQPVNPVDNHVMNIPPNVQAVPHGNNANIPSLDNNNNGLGNVASSSLSSPPSIPPNMAQDAHSLNTLLSASIEILSRTFQRIRRRDLAIPVASIPPDHASNDFTKFELNLFVSRREYENGRCLLMRNLRSIPNLCQLVSASTILPTVEGINTTSTTTAAATVP
ncbi:unnamed protein product [Trichobilharzia szidati]|nr:unnamed protein product [Trichobilharzia szidati]